MVSNEHIVHWNPLAEGDSDFGPCVIAVGIFDGMHLGHQKLFREAREQSTLWGVPLVAITFDRDPDEMFRQSFEKLLTNQRRLELISHCANRVISLPSTREVFSIAPRDFLAFVGESLHPKAICVGSDFRFGAKAAGTVADIKAWGAENGCACLAIDLQSEDGSVVSATRIRELLLRGDAGEAFRLMGRPHEISGHVEHGRGEGTGMGFATANLDLSQNSVLVPRDGVYAGYVRVDGVLYPSAINMGRAASFEEATAQLETHLLGFEGDLYGKDVQVLFIEWLRDQRVFDSTDELIATVMDNINWVKTHLGEGPKPEAAWKDVVLEA